MISLICEKDSLEISNSGGVSNFLDAVEIILVSSEFVGSVIAILSVDRAGMRRSLLMPSNFLDTVENI